MANPPVTKQAVASWRKRYDDFARPTKTLQQVQYGMPRLLRLGLMLAQVAPRRKRINVQTQVWSQRRIAECPDKELLQRCNEVRI
jgi:hypothetical protein